MLDKFNKLRMHSQLQIIGGISFLFGYIGAGISNIWWYFVLCIVWAFTTYKLEQEMGKTFERKK